MLSQASLAISAAMARVSAPERGARATPMIAPAAAPKSAPETKLKVFPMIILSAGTSMPTV